MYKRGNQNGYNANNSIVRCLGARKICFLKITLSMPFTFLCDKTIVIGLFFPGRYTVDFLYNEPCSEGSKNSLTNFLYKERFFILTSLCYKELFKIEIVIKQI